MLRLAAERERLTVVNDQRGCPTAAGDVAAACLKMALQCASASAVASYGTYHFAGTDDASWFELAQEIVSLSARQTGRMPDVIPVHTAEFPAAAIRRGYAARIAPRSLATFRIGAAASARYP